MTRALVLIHGIGEQRPMETMWRFVRGAFGVDETGVGHWDIGSDKPITITARSKPDRLSGNFELRRINIDPPEGVNKDFPEGCSFDQWHCYELFWQHVFRGHRFRDILDWLGDILDPCRQLGSARLWIVRLFLYAIIALLGIPYLLYIIGPDWVTSTLREAVECCWRWITTWDLLASTLRQAREAVEGFWRWIAAWDFASRLAIILLVSPIIGILLRQSYRIFRLGPVFFLDIIGDAASYLDGHPRNVAKRNVVREASRELIKKLHAERTGKGGPKYSEIIVVGHSLGSVIGYDVLYSVWQDVNRQVYDQKPLQAAECAAQSKDPENYRARQQELFQTVSGNSNGWRVSRFVTLGSPLTHAQFLLASSRDEIRQRRDRREFPSCPPVMENGRFSFPKKPPFKLHHAALFAVTIWTNIYFPWRWLIL